MVAGTERTGAERAMLTVQSLVDEVGLELAAGEEAADAPVRWVHITELPDPTPWLSGGELLLTTGMQLDGRRRAARVRARLADHHLAGLGFGTGFEHDEIPPALARRGRAARLPAVRGAVRDAVHRDHREGVRRASSTSSTSRSSAASRSSGGSSSSCSRSAGSTRWRARSSAAIGGAVVVLDRAAR